MGMKHKNLLLRFGIFIFLNLIFSVDTNAETYGVFNTKEAANYAGKYCNSFNEDLFITQKEIPWGQVSIFDITQLGQVHNGFFR
jgi:hypothetical protein